MDDYPKDPMGYDSSAFTPINQEGGMVKDEPGVEPTLESIKEQVKEEPKDEVSAL